MPSTYTTNLGIEKIASGDQSGTWGATTNTNFDIIDQAINGVAQITLASAGTSGSPNTLAITNGAVSDGRNKFIEFVDGGDLGATAYVQLTPNDAEKIVVIRNSLSASRSVIVFQGTYSASNDFEVTNGKDVVLKFSGAGASATVTQVFDDLLVSALSTTTLNLGGTAVTSTAAEINILDGVTATTAELNYVDGVTSNIQTQLDSKSSSTSPTFTGTVTIATADINGGNIDGTAIGSSSASTGNFSTLSIAGSAITSTAAEINILDGVTATTAELNYVDGVTSAIQTQLNTKATIASPTFTGTVTIPTADINGGAIDGTAIGGTVASTGNFSTLSIGGSAITATAAEINILDGVTATTAEINKLDGLTATTTELNYVDGVTSAIQTQLNAKASAASPTLTGTTSISTLSLGGTTITATAAEINILDGVTATTTELNYTDGVTSNIQTQLNAKAPIASPTFTGTSTVPSLVLGSGSTVTSIKDEDNMASNSNTALATQQSIKAYVDNSAVDLTAITTDVEPNTSASNDLGSATKLWQDLYLSGGIYFNGSGSADYLDDYEKGTFTLNVGGSYLVPLSGTVSSYYAEYVKIGRVVHVFGQINGSSLAINSGTGTGYLIFGTGALPFATTNNGGQSPNETFTGVVGDGSGYGLTSAGSRTASVSAVYGTDWSWGPTSFSSGAINAVCTYMTDS